MEVDINFFVKFDKINLPSLSIKNIPSTSLTIFCVFKKFANCFLLFWKILIFLFRSKATNTISDSILFLTSIT